MSRLYIYFWSWKVSLRAVWRGLPGSIWLVPPWIWDFKYSNGFARPKHQWSFDCKWLSWDSIRWMMNFTPRVSVRLGISTSSTLLQAFAKRSSQKLMINFCIFCLDGSTKKTSKIERIYKNLNIWIIYSWWIAKFKQIKFLFLK